MEIILSPEKLSYLLLAVSIILIIIGVMNYLPYIGARKWISTEGVILNIEEKNKYVWLSVFGGIKYYYPKIEYGYQYNGKEYTSDKVGFSVKDYWIPEVDEWGNIIGSDKRFWTNWVENKAVQIFVNPLCPTKSVITNKPGKKNMSHIIGLIGSGTILMIVAIWFLNLS